MRQNELDLASIIAGINQNTDNVRQLEADVKISMNGLPAAISGTLLMEFPDHLRLQAGLLGMTDLGVDIGSNEDVFWIWAKTALPGQQSTILYARHDEFMKSDAGRQMRLQPKWIVNAMGLIRFEAGDKHEGPFIGKDKRLEIRSEIISDGVRMTRVVLVNPKYGWIEQVAFYDAEQNRIAYANATNHRYEEEYTATLPRHVQLFVYPEGGEKMELTIKVTRSQINQLNINPETTWAMPNPADIPAIDMTRMQNPNLQISPGTQTLSPPNQKLGLQPSNMMARERGYTVTR